MQIVVNEKEYQLQLHLTLHSIEVLLLSDHKLVSFTAIAMTLVVIVSIYLILDIGLFDRFN
jgi:hypothetical protein